MTESRDDEVASEKIIRYSELSKFANSADRAKRYLILLTKFQAKLYQKKMEHDFRPLGNMPAFVDTVLYTSRLALLMLCCPKLLLLGYFHDFDRKSWKDVEFKEYEGGVLFITKSNSTQRRDGFNS